MSQVVTVVNNAGNLGQQVIVDDFPRSVPPGVPNPAPIQATNNPEVINGGGVTLSGNIIDSNNPQTANVNTVNNINDFGTFTKKPYRVIEIDLSVARTDLMASYSGTALWVVDGTDSNCLIKVKFDGTDNDAVPTRPGFYLAGFPFDQLFLTNEVQAGKSIFLMIFDDAPLDRVDGAN